MTGQMRIASLLTAITVISFNTFSPAYSAGRTNNSIANTVLSGKGSPTSKLGINGDFYIDVTNFNIYGPKSNNRWPTPVSLKGPAGVDGKPGEKGSSTSGSNGSKGDKGEKGEKGETGEKGDKGEKGDVGIKGEIGDIGLTGAAGLVGATGAQGLKGDKGDTGATGLTGAQGLVGATGLTGAAGIKGDKGDTGATGATGPAGATGPQGIQGLKGDTGTTGATGPQGPAGATGATGPSNVQVISIQSFTLNTNNPNTSSMSPSFGNLVAGEKYKFEIIVLAKSSSIIPRIGLEVYSGGTGNNLKYNYMVSQVEEYRSLNPWYGNQFMVIGTLTVGAATSSLSVNLIDGNGSTGSSPIVATGTAVITLVGSITG